MKDVREPSTVDATLLSWGHHYNACAHWPCRYDSEKCTKGDADADYLDVDVENESKFGWDSYWASIFFRMIMMRVDISGDTLCRDNCQLIGMPFFHTRSAGKNNPN